MSILNNLASNLIKTLTPPPLIQDPEYDGLEYRWKFFVFRPAVLKEELKYESLLFLAVVFYAVFFLVGSSINSKRANNWFKTHLPLFREQFSRPTNGGLKSDGYSDFFNFSTGRRSITSLHSVFTMRPRHDLLQILYQFAWGMQELSYKPVDELELDFKLSDEALPGFVFAIVSKDELSQIRDKRWDLTFARTSENPALPPSLSVMSEYADITDQFLNQPTNKLSLVQLLNDPAILPYFRSLSITDQPRDRPDLPVPAANRQKHLILSLSAPPASRVADTLPFVTALFPLIDALSKINLRPETKIKLRKAREEVDKAIKEDSEKEKREEMEADRLAAKKKAEDERVSKLSGAEQKRILEREKKRAIKKSQTARK